VAIKIAIHKLFDNNTTCLVYFRWEFENDVFDRALATAQAWHIGAAASVEAATANSSVSNSSDTGDAAVPHALGMWTSHGPYSPFMHTLVPGLKYELARV